MSSDPCVKIVLSKRDTGEVVIEEFRELIEPARRSIIVYTTTNTTAAVTNVTESFFTARPLI